MQVCERLNLIKSPVLTKEQVDCTFFITAFTVSMDDKVKTLTAVSGADAGEMDAQSEVFMIIVTEW